MKAWEARLYVAQERPHECDSSLKWMEMSSRFWALYGCRIVAATPLKRAGTLVDPSVTGDHLGHSHRVEAEQSERQTDACSRRDSSAATGTCCRTGHNAGSAPRGSGPPCRARDATRAARSQQSPARRARPHLRPSATVTRRKTPSECSSDTNSGMTRSITVLSAARLPGRLLSPPAAPAAPARCQSCVIRPLTMT